MERFAFEVPLPHAEVLGDCPWTVPESAIPARRTCWPARASRVATLRSMSIEIASVMPMDPPLEPLVDTAPRQASEAREPPA